MTATTRATPALLWSRAALLATVVVVVSAVGHVSADGRLPGPSSLAALLVATTVVSARFLTRQASTLRLVALLVGGQSAIHAALTAMAGHGPPPRPTGPAASFVFEGTRTERTGSYFDQVAAMQASSAVEPGAAAGPDVAAGISHLVEHLSTQNPAMVLAHLLAVVLLGAWLAVGERALWTVLMLTTKRLSRVVPRAAAAALARSVCLLLERVRRTPSLAATGRPAVPLPHLLHHVVAHRGPPALLAS